MLLFVGLGNPGTNHARNRHNIGFMAVDEIVRRHSFGPFRARYRGLAAEGRLAGEKVLALEPLTYMNHSGQSVAAAARFYKIATEDIVVFHDELDLAPGKIRVKRGGGAAGHNGLRSISRAYRARLSNGCASASAIPATRICVQRLRAARLHQGGPIPGSPTT